MSECPCDNQREPGLEAIPAGLDSLPRQQRAFPEVRRDLLARVPDKTALGDWRAREESDLGLMWLDMWAYVADVLNFYDERISNETYVRTAARRVSLRRIVELLGHFPKPGVAGTAAVAAIAEGRTEITLPIGTAFRSDGFDGEAPQVFENDSAEFVHPLTNQWEIGPVRLSPSVPLQTDELIFETASFSLAKDSLVLFEGPGAEDRRASIVASVTPFEGKDGVTYLRVKLRDTLTFEQGISGVRVRTPSVVATVSPFASNPIDIPFADATEEEAAAARSVGFPVDIVGVTLNGLYPQVRRGEALIVARGLGPTAAFRKAYVVDTVRTESVSVNQQALPVTVATLANARQDGLQNRPEELSFHFAFVDAGALTTVSATEVSTSVLASDQGVFLDGIQETPPQAVNGELSQRFLLRDADDHGAAVGGRIVFQDDGRARFFLDDPLEIPFETLKTPITLFGNVIEASRGESVFNEVLGSGNPRIARQQVQLKKKPLTYLHAGASAIDPQVKSTLAVRVDGVQWREVKTFFGCGPDDPVYIVRHDELENTTITFGDGVRGRRPPSGVNNIVANYRFGAGFAAPPEGAITQLAAAVRGLRGVESPVAATPGKDPEGPDELRTAAPKTALLLGRAVSPSDFEAIANTTPGVTRAQAQWLWLADVDGLEDRLEAGVHVFFIGDVDAASLKNTLLAQAEPTIPVAVTEATPIAVALELTIEVDPRFVQADVESTVKRVLTDPETGLLSLKKAQVGGVFFPSRLYDAVMEVEGVVGVSGASFTNLSGNGVIVPDRGSACIPTGTFLDFVEEGSVSVTGVAPIGPTPGTGIRHGAEKPSGPLPPSRLGESTPASDEPAPEPAQDGFEQYYSEKLWALLPEVYRNEDGQGRNPGALRAIIEVIAEDAARVRRSLDRLWEDQHAETADDWAVPYIGDLVSAPLSQVLDDRARRVITALAVNFRRRRGTPELLERLVRFIGGWDVAFVEAFLRLARTRHLLDARPTATGRFTRTPPGGTADLRRPVGSEIASGPFGEYFHTPDFRPLRGRLGQFGVQRLNFHLFRLQAFHVTNVDPFELVPATAGMIRFTFDPSGRDTQLFSFVAPDVATSDRASICRRPFEWEITGPIRCRLLGNAEFVITASAVNDVAPPPTPPNPPSAARVALLKLLGIRFPDAGTLETRLEDLNAGLTSAEFIELLRLTMTDDSGRKNLYPQSLQLGADPAEFPREIIAAADLSDLACQAVPSLSIVDALIDPETGRFSTVPPAGPPDPPELVAYTYGFSDALGAGPYPRQPLPGLGPTQNVSGGGNATLSDNTTTQRGLTIEDSRTYTVTIQSGNTLKDAVLRADVGERPLLLIAGDAPGDAFGANLQPENGAPRRLVIEGVWLTSSDVEAELDPDEPARIVVQARTDATSESDWSEILIRNATLDPGGTRADGVRIPPLVIEIEGTVDRLVIERSIVGAIVIRQSAGPNPTPLGRVQVLEIKDSIVDGQRYEAEGPDRVTIDNAFDDVILDRVTVFGDVRAERLFASDTIVFGRVRVVNNQDGCFRFSASSLGAGVRLPPRFQDFPDLPAGVERPLEPSIFSSRTFGEPGYAQLSEAAPPEIARGAENGSEMGAFSSLLGPLRLDSVQNLVREFQPVGRLAQFLFEGDRGVPHHGEFGEVPPPVGPSTPFDPDPGAPIPVPDPPPPVLPTECPPPPDDDDDEEPPVPPAGAPFVVLGVQDADLNGAPDFWRGLDEGGNWRPGGASNDRASGSIGGIPFDKCDFVHEYDARFGTRPDVAGDNTQGTWAPQTVLTGHYEITSGRGVLEVDVPSTAVSYWQRDVVTPAGRPESISAYAVFAIDDVTADTEKDEGFDMAILANTGGDKFKGLRAVYHDPDSGDGGPAEFQYIKLDPPGLGDAHKNVSSGQPVDRIRRVWHKMSLQGRFAETNTITSLDGRVNYELLSFFGESPSSGPASATFRARFGVIKTGSKALGRLRNFVASAPGRFIRAWFRAHTPVADPVLNLYFVGDPLPAGETATQAQFRVRYASAGTGFVPFSVPTNRKVFLVDATTSHRIHKVSVRLDTSGVESGSTTLPILADRPLWFTVERTNNAASDPRRSTLYLVQAVLAPG